MLAMLFYEITLGNIIIIYLIFRVYIINERSLGPPKNQLKMVSRHAITMIIHVPKSSQYHGKRYLDNVWIIFSLLLIRTSNNIFRVPINKSSAYGNNVDRTLEFPKKIGKRETYSITKSIMIWKVLKYEWYNIHFELLKCL